MEIPKSPPKLTPEQIANIKRISEEKERSVRILNPKNPDDQKTIEAIKKLVPLSENIGEERYRRQAQ
ncbi:MAG TPA: hypothetical protein VJL38_00325 [Patescibacteria group bacterium]|nr:hypothetical protein [Patescibacteria group bacterium]